jgi:tetratricopeptide (TPR) repeat protein
VRRRCLAVPVLEVARAELDLAAPPRVAWEDLLDHGLALADQLADRAAEATPLLEEAHARAPKRWEPLAGLARLALLLGRTDDAVAWAERARARGPRQPAPLFYAASALYAAYRLPAARAQGEALLDLTPDDRAALALLARLRGLTGDPRGALAAAEHLATIDPQLADARYQQALALGELDRSTEAEAAMAAYLRYRPAFEVDLDLRERFRRREPARAEEMVPVHEHTLR